jgi:hypothetical protein
LHNPHPGCHAIPWRRVLRVHPRHLKPACAIIINLQEEPDGLFNSHKTRRHEYSQPVWSKVPHHEARAVHAVTQFCLMAKYTERPTTTRLAPKNRPDTGLIFKGIPLYLHFL